MARKFFFVTNWVNKNTQNVTRNCSRLVNLDYAAILIRVVFHDVINIVHMYRIGSRLIRIDLMSFYVVTNGNIPLV